MNDTASQMALVLFPFLAGNLCSILNRRPKVNVIGRPLARATLVFCLGIWFLDLPSATSEAAGFVPWILLAHLALSFIPCDERADPRGLRFDALLYSASFLSAICLTRNLGFLIVFGESLAVSTWLTDIGEHRRRMVQRSLATFVLIAAGTGLILSHTATAEFSRLAGTLDPVIGQSSADQFGETKPDSSLAMRAGVLLLISGLAWRIGFFPFNSVSESGQTIGTLQRQLSLMLAATLELSVLLPRLTGYENLGLMLLMTLAVPTLVREIWRSRKWHAPGELWFNWWTASAALVWISLALGLLSLRQELPLGIWLPAGLTAVRLELLNSLGTFIVLAAVTQAFSALGQPLQSRESLTGLLWTMPFHASVIMLGVLNWVGLPVLAGFAPRWGLVASLLEVAGSGLDGSDYFLLIAVLVLGCQMVMTFQALFIVQSLCDPSPTTRPAGETQVWSVWPFAVLLFAIVAADWMWRSAG